MLPAIASIVFNLLFLPGNGDTMLSMTTEALRAASLRQKRRADISRPVVPAAAFRVNEKDRAQFQADAAAASGRPSRPSSTPARARVAKKPIRAVNYPQPAFEQRPAQCKASPPWRTHGVEGSGHDIMVDKPDEFDGSR